MHGGMKIYGFSYSPYVRKVQLLLDLAGHQYERIEVPYGDRTELVQVTGGYLQVPVLVTHAGQVICDSRDICEHVLVGEVAAQLVPSPYQGAIWAYADFVDNVLEDLLFRIATPELADKKATPGERALFIYIKERKFGPGCVDQWREQRTVLVARARRLLAPTLQTLAQTPFLFGERPSLADAALYGNLAMLEGADARHLSLFSDELEAYMRRLEAEARRRQNAV